MEQDTSSGSQQSNTSTISDIIHGIAAYTTTVGSNYRIFYDATRSCAVTVIDVTAVTANGAKKLIAGQAPRNGWVFRLDNPHVGAQFPHININKKITGISDPHIPLPPGGVTAGKYLAKGCQVVNDVAVVAAIGTDVYEMANAIIKDYQNGTNENTTDTALSVTGRWTGGCIGSKAGAAIGTLLIPGVGTITGGLIGGVLGSTYGGKLNTQTVVGIADPSNYIELMKSAKWISTAVADKVATGLESITLPLSQGGQNNNTSAAN